MSNVKPICRVRVPSNRKLGIQSQYGIVIKIFDDTAAAYVQLSNGIMYYTLSELTRFDINYTNQWLMEHAGHVNQVTGDD